MTTTRTAQAGSTRTAQAGSTRAAPLAATWPLTALFVLYPLWWALGLPAIVFVLLAAPMAWQLRRRGSVRVPPGFGLWLVLLLWVLLSGLVLDLTAPGTMPPTGSGRYLGWAVRVLNYTALTVVMLYVLNLRERELPQLRVLRLFGFLAVVTVIGGYVGMFLPQLRFVAPLNALLPRALADEPFVSRLMHVEVAQVQDVLPGEPTSPRPAAPFEYTNTWGENLAILLVWFVVGWVVFGGRVRRPVGYLVLLAAVPPAVYSLNRGLWIALALTVAYVGIRLALRSRMTLLAGLAVATALIGLLVVFSPLGTLLNERIAHGHSDQIRATLSVGAIRAANHSPVLGYGSSRALIGSNRSIAIGRSAECRQCGNRELGSNGQLWTLLVGQGYVGAFCYNAFFLYFLWRFRHDHSPIGIAGGAVLVLMLFFQFLYGALNTTLAYGLISVAVLARNDQLRPVDRPTPLGSPGER